MAGIGGASNTYDTFANVLFGWAALGPYRLLTDHEGLFERIGEKQCLFFLRHKTDSREKRGVSENWGCREAEEPGPILSMRASPPLSHPGLLILLRIQCSGIRTMLHPELSIPWLAGGEKRMFWSNTGILRL